MLLSRRTNIRTASGSNPAVFSPLSPLAVPLLLKPPALEMVGAPLARDLASGSDTGPGGRAVITPPQASLCQKLGSQRCVRTRTTASGCGTVARMDLAYCRVSTTAQDLARQIDAMRATGVAEEHIYVDKRTGANMDREGLTALLGFARPGDRINVLTLDRLGRNMRETLNLVHDLTERGVFLRTLGDKLAVDTSEPGPGTDMAI